MEIIIIIKKGNNFEPKNRIAQFMDMLLWFTEFARWNTPIASMQRGLTHPTSVLYMTLKNRMIRLQ